VKSGGAARGGLGIMTLWETALASMRNGNGISARTAHAHFLLAKPAYEYQRCSRNSSWRRLNKALAEMKPYRRQENERRWRHIGLTWQSGGRSMRRRRRAEGEDGG
jgi:hypothetical protein